MNRSIREQTYALSVASDDSACELPVEFNVEHTEAAPSARAPLRDRVLTMVAIGIPLIGLVTAVFLLWGWGISGIDLGLLLGMYFVTMLAISLGFHRLFTHGSFETSNSVKVILAALGGMAVQGSVLHWVAIHRRHHQHSDTADDPHSPHGFGGGARGILSGAWHAHMGWFFEADPPNLSHYVQDLSKSRALCVASGLFPLWIILGLLIPALLGGWLSGAWSGAFTGFIWGGLVRVFLVHHVTWGVNSVCHLWGSQPYRSNDMSRNNFLFGVFALGDGWHNTHHAFPKSARHGLKWWQVDPTYGVIRVLELMGLAWNVRLPSEQAQKQRLAS